MKMKFYVTVFQVKKIFLKVVYMVELFLSGLGEFFRQGKHYRKDCIDAVITKLKRIEKWFLKQKKYASKQLNKMV